MGKKIWLPKHLKNFSFDKIICTSTLHVRGCEMSHLLARSPGHILSVFNLELDIYVMAVQQKASQRACFPIKL